MIGRKFTVLLKPAEKGGFIAKSLDVPIASEGRTKEEALKNIKEAIEGYLEVLNLDGRDDDKTSEIIVEEVTEENVTGNLPEVPVSRKERREIKRAVQEMENGKFVTLEQLTEALDYEKDKAAKQYMEGKTSLSGAAESAKLTVPEMVDYLVSKGYKSEYSMDDFREGITLLKDKLKAGKTGS
jgi:Uncharacterized conserved protein